MFLFQFQSIPTFLLIMNFARSVHSVQESELFPHEESDGSTSFDFGDDGKTSVSLTTPITIFNKTYWSIIISGNGVIALGRDSIENAAAPCQPTPTDNQKIMAFWSDANRNVDARTAKLLHMQTTEPSLLQKAKDDIIIGFPKFRRKALRLTWMLIITWKNLPRHNTNGAHRNTFQLVLTKSDSHSFVLFYYSKLEWSSDASWAGGFDFGNARAMYKLPGSCTTAFRSVLTGSNLGGGSHPGKYVFKVESALEVPGSNVDFQRSGGVTQQSLSFQPRIVSVMGNLPMLVRGLDLDEDANVTCSFLDPSLQRPSRTNGAVVISEEESIVVCPVPYLYSLGKITVNLLVSYPTASAPSLYMGHIFVVKEHELGPLPQIYINRTLENSLLLSATWDPASIRMDDVKLIDLERGSTNQSCVHEVIEIVILEFNGKVCREIGPVTPPILNNGLHLSPIDLNTLRELTKPTGKSLPRTFALKAKYNLTTGTELQKLLPSNTLIGTEMIISRQQPSNIEVESTDANMFDKICKTWSDKEPLPPIDTLPCPRIVAQARTDWRFAIDTSPHLEIFNPGAASSYIQKVPSTSGAGSQCSYDDEGRLMINPPSAGRLHRRSTNNWKDYWAHYWQDVMPYLYCCRWSVSKDHNCISDYYSKRPSDKGKDYVFPRPSRITGVGHITTFDGLNYTQIGAGEYWMMKYSNEEDDLPMHDYTNEFKMQIRMEPFESEFAAIITEAVMADCSNGKNVKVQVAISQTPDHHISVTVDGELITETNGSGEADDFNLYHDGVTLSISGSQVTASFSSGVSIYMSSGTNQSSLNIVATVASHLKGRTAGLWGDFNDDSSNDLKLPNGTSLDIIPEKDNDTMPTVHTNFGATWLIEKDDSLFAYPSESGKAYGDFNDPTFSRQTYLGSDKTELTFSVPQEFCDDFEECNYDYGVTDSKSIAEGGMGAYIMYREVLQMASTLVGQCEPPPKLVNGQVIVSSLASGSHLTVSCDSGYKLRSSKNGTFECGDGDTSNSGSGESFQWVNGKSKEVMTPLSCVPESSDAEMPPVALATTTTKKVPKTTRQPFTTTKQTVTVPLKVSDVTEEPIQVPSNVPLTTSPTLEEVATHESLEYFGVSSAPLKIHAAKAEPSGISGTEIFILFIVIAVSAIIVGVIVAEYPRCRPIRMYVVNRLRPNSVVSDLDELEL